MRKVLLFLFSSAVLPAARADVSLPSLISDNMLLQRSKAFVDGQAAPGEKVKVTLGSVSASTVTGKDGKWRVKLDGLKAGEPGAMTITGKNKIVVKNVAVGDVWVCAGQANMSLPVASASNSQTEITTADSPDIRMFTVTRKSSDDPVAGVEGKWEVCDEASVGHWSATGYFFARQLHDDLELPIGMIHASWPGPGAQSWTPKGVLQADFFLASYCSLWTAFLDDYPAAKEAYDKALSEWSVVAESAKAAKQRVPRAPLEPPGPGSWRSPGAIYNGMIQPLTAYSIKGVIWYQGESNVRDVVRYRKLFPALIASWRNGWNDPDLPFLFAQIANIMPRRDLPSDSYWAELREAQGAALPSPHTGMAVTIDIGEAASLHPKNKQEVGRRLALAAEAGVYGKSIVASGPLFENAKFDGDTVTITFKPGTAVGLGTKDHEPIKGFAVAGDDRNFVWATATIVGADPVDHTGTLTLPPVAAKSGKKAKSKAAPPPREQTLTVHSLAVPKPVAVRYAWADNPEVNLVNKAALPAVPFRTDDWPQEPPPPLPLPVPKVVGEPATTTAPSPANTPAAAANVRR